MTSDLTDLRTTATPAGRRASGLTASASRHAFVDYRDRQADAGDAGGNWARAAGGFDALVNKILDHLRGNCLHNRKAAASDCRMEAAAARIPAADPAPVVVTDDGADDPGFQRQRLQERFGDLISFCREVPARVNRPQRRFRPHRIMASSFRRRTVIKANASAPRPIHDRRPATRQGTDRPRFGHARRRRLPGPDRRAPAARPVSPASTCAMAKSTTSGRRTAPAARCWCCSAIPTWCRRGRSRPGPAIRSCPRCAMACCTGAAPPT